jgi:hypothetical protein
MDSKLNCLALKGAMFGAAACISMCLPARAQSESELRAESVLLNKFETVVYTKTEIIAPVMPFLSRDEDVPADVSESTTFLAAPFGELSDGLVALDPNVEKDIERNYEAILVGSRDFGFDPIPRKFGAIRSHKCYIGVSRAGAKPNMEPGFSKASKKSISGRTVWTWPVPLGGEIEGSEPWFAVQLRDSYFVVSNDQKAFEETLNALVSTADSNPKPIRAIGWESFRTHKYWCYRSLRSESPAHPRFVFDESITPDIIALTFYADNNKKEGRIQVFSSDTRVRPAPAIFPDSVSIQLHSQGAGVWGATIPLPDSLPEDDQNLFVLMCLIGFGGIV